MRGISARHILLLAAATASLGWGQPAITSLQSSAVGDPAANVTGITSGTVLPAGGFVLYINGTFHPAGLVSLKWFNSATATTSLLPLNGAVVSPSQIYVTVPNALFQTLVASPVAVTVTVQETGGSNSAAFTINPPLQLITPVLPSATINAPYSANFTTGGTVPFLEGGIVGGTPPPGLNALSPSVTVTGTPTQTGVYNFQVTAQDFWGNSVGGTETIEVVSVPTLTSLSPNASGAGAPTFTMTVNGTNFVGPINIPGLTIPGSQVQWTFGSLVTPLTTTFVNSTQLTAAVPGALLAVAGTASVTVVQPSYATSNALPFSVLAPSISAIVPATAAAGSSTVALVVNGANFVLNATFQPTVWWNGATLISSFVNSGTMTAAIPANLLTTPGVYSVQVTNPGGAGSNTVTFSVLAPTIASLSATSLPAGSPAFALTATGANFLSGSQISFRGTALAATVGGNGTTLTSTVPASLLTAPGVVNVQVVNPGGALSNVVTFTVVAPSLASISPATVPVGSAAFTLAVTGASFVSGAQVSVNSTALATTFVSSNSLTAAVPANLVAATGQCNVQVANPGGAPSNTLPLSVVGPTIGSLSPASIPAGSATFALAVSGVNFVPGSQVSFDGNQLATSFASSTLLNATVPATLVAGPKVSSIVVANPGTGGNVSAGATFTVTQSLAINATALPSGTTGSSYSFTFTGRAGTPPYTWSATGYPPGLAINPASGVLSGVPQTSGSYVVTVVLRDAANSTATAQFPLAVGSPAPAPVSIAPTSNLPSGTVGVAYQGFVFANGGSGGYTFSLGGGSLPNGLALSSSGMVFGTPTTPGPFSFTVVVTDSAGATTSGGFRITINPAPLGIAGGPAGPVSTGTAINITFTGTGGVGPYYCTLGGSLPPGATFANCVLSGTPTTAGTYTFRITIVDSTGAVFTQTVTLTVVLPAPALSLSGSLANGKVGVPYAGQISASGGTGPYTYAGTGLPGGLSLSASGAITGTPGTAGQFSLAAAVTDSKGATASGTFGITIVPADLTVVTASLPDGVVGIAYSASLTASGGVPPYSWTVTGLPDGLTATAAGAISGTPTTPGKFTVVVMVKDVAGTTFAPRIGGYTLTLTIAPAALAITTATAPNGTVGAAYTATFAASGGTAPYTFSATGLPAGLSISATGAITGTPTAPGAATIVVTGKDAAGVSTSKSFSVTIGLPPAPPLGFVGISNTSLPLQQPRLQVTLGNTFPVDVVVTLTLTFAPDSGADDPTIQFSSGGRTAHITVPAGATNGATDVGVQTGSVAGLIAITAQMQAAGQDVTPSPAPVLTIRIAAAAPVIVPGTLTAVRNSTGFTVTLTGYATDRELTQAMFQFTAAAGSTLQTTSVTVAIDTLFAGYFSGAGATPFGSQFTYTQPFTVTGSAQTVASVTVTLVNKIGQSAAVTATLQ